MQTLQTLAMCALSTLLLAPLLLLYGLPFLVVARIVHARTARWSARTRQAVVGAIAALGIAPAYDVYLAPSPLYTWALRGQPPAPGVALLSLVLTWLLVLAALRLLHRAPRPA